jgi:hypothetical protein
MEVTASCVMAGFYKVGMYCIILIIALQYSEQRSSPGVGRAPLLCVPVHALFIFFLSLSIN